VTVDLKFLDPPSRDAPHPDRLLWAAAGDHLGIRKETPIGYDSM
jgi:hypothetical protein